MTCYMRHMDWLFEALELPADKEHRRQVDAAIRDVLALPVGVHCPDVWAAIKVLDGDGQTQLVEHVGAWLDQGPPR
jgi:hypothetical protein